MTDSLESNSDNEKKQKVVRDFKPSAVKLGIEALTLGLSASKSGLSHYEIQSDIDFDRYFFVNLL